HRLDGADHRAEREGGPGRDPAPLVERLDHRAEHDRRERRDHARAIQCARSGVAEANRERALAAGCIRGAVAAGARGPPATRRAPPRSPTGTAAHHAAAGTVSAWTNALPAVAIRPKNTKTITS